jgi:hypothetical protein
MLKEGTPLARCKRSMTRNPPLSQTNDDQLVAGEDRGIDVRVHQKIAAVAHHDEDVALGSAIAAPQPPAIS